MFPTWYLFLFMYDTYHVELVGSLWSNVFGSEYMSLSEGGLPDAASSLRGGFQTAE